MTTNITNSFRGILAILLFFLSLPMMGAIVTSKYQVDNLYYTLYYDGTAKVTSYVENSTEVEIQQLWFIKTRSIPLPASETTLSTDALA